MQSERAQGSWRPARLIAHALAGAWRREVQSARLTTDDLSMIAPWLLASDSSGLCWRRIRDTQLAPTAIGSEIRAAYQRQVLQSALRQRSLGRAVRTLQAAGIDPLVAKGWAVGRFYTERGLRPYGDVDLYVGSERYSAARRAIQDSADVFDPILRTEIDLQRHPVELKDRAFADLFARSLVVHLGDLQIRVLSAEDQLRMSCLHLLRHEGLRPLWWCDLGAIIEATPTLDWERVFWGSKRRAAWIACTVRLAHELLDVRLDTLPASHRVDPLPTWLIPAIYRRWEDGMATRPSRVALSYVRDPRGLWQGLYERWPNPLAATLHRGGYPDASPRWPYQVYEMLRRISLYGYRHVPPWRAQFLRQRFDDQQDLLDRRQLSI